MPSVLESVEWGRPALTLLSKCKQLDPNLPAVMHVRHTERPMEKPGSPDIHRITSTRQGRQVAREFGAGLPHSRSYRLYHTNIERTRETAENIHEGILANDGSSNVIGSVPLIPTVDRDRWFYYVRREYKMDSEKPWLLNLFTKWISGHYPPWVRVPALDFSQRGAALMMKNLKSAKTNTFDIYVSHDTTCGAFLLHWFGTMIDERWIEFLDGFIMQLTEERMHVYTKDGKKESNYPYWWKFKTL